jgi:hypothetical protein
MHHRGSECPRQARSICRPHRPTWDHSVVAPELSSSPALSETGITLGYLGQNYGTGVPASDPWTWLLVGVGAYLLYDNLFPEGVQHAYYKRKVAKMTPAQRREYAAQYGATPRSLAGGYTKSGRKRRGRS